MKVKDLIEYLKNFHDDLDVVIKHPPVEDAGLYDPSYKILVGGAVRRLAKNERGDLLGNSYSGVDFLVLRGK